MCSFAARPIYLVVAVAVLSAAVAEPDAPGHGQVQQGPPGDATRGGPPGGAGGRHGGRGRGGRRGRHGKKDKDCDKKKGSPGADAKISQGEATGGVGPSSADAMRGHGQWQASAAGDSHGHSRSADATRGHGQFLGGAAEDSKSSHGQSKDGSAGKKGLSRDMIPFVVLAAAGVVLTLTTCVVVVSWRRCRANSARSLQSDAARLEQGEAGQGSVAKDVVATGVPIDNNVVITGIPVNGEGASSAAGKV